MLLKPMISLFSGVVADVVVVDLKVLIISYGGPRLLSAGIQQEESTLQRQQLKCGEENTSKQPLVLDTS